jgi:hypothetical protein
MVLLLYTEATNVGDPKLTKRHSWRKNAITMIKINKYFKHSENIKDISEEGAGCLDPPPDTALNTSIRLKKKTSVLKFEIMKFYHSMMFLIFSKD